MLSLIMCSMPSKAITISENGFIYTVNDDGKTLTLTGTEEDATLPDTLKVADAITYEGVYYPIVGIGRSAFLYRSNFRAIYLGNNVTTIGSRAFISSRNLTILKCDSALKSIGDSAFYNASKLSDIDLGGCESIGERAFNGNSSMTSINLPESLREIKDFAFASCTRLTTVTIPANVAKIGQNPFRGCSALQEVKVDAANNSFAADGGVLYDKQLTKLYSYPNAKEGEIFNLPSSVKVLCPHSLRNTSLTSIELNEGLDSILDYALCSNTSLTEITIPSTVNYIGSAVLFYDNSLESINVASGNSAYTSDNGYLLSADKTQLIASIPRSGELTIPSPVETIGAYVFYGQPITKLSLPNTMRTIDEAAFYFCSKLTDVDWGSGIETIDTFAFQRCTSLTKVNLPSTIRTIGLQAFFYDTGIKEITLPEGIVRLGAASFNGCTGVSEITVPGSLRVIEPAAFYECTALKNVILSEGLQETGQMMFAYCSALDSVAFPSTLKRIGNDSFYQNTSLPSISFPEGLTYIGNDAFYECNALTEVAIPNSVDTIGEFAFSWDGGLQSITMGAGLKYLGQYALYNSVPLTKITLNEGLEYIGEGAMCFLRNLEEIRIPSTVKGFGDGILLYDYNLKNFYNDAVTPQQLSYDVVSNYSNPTLYVPVGSVEAYKSAEYWQNFQNIQGHDPTGISTLENSPSPEATVIGAYDMNGKRVSLTTSGIQLRRMSDGTVRKVIVK